MRKAMLGLVLVAFLGSLPGLRVLAAGGFKLIGSAAFKERVSACLGFLAEKYSDGYNFADYYIEKIQEWRISGMDVATRTWKLAWNTINAYPGCTWVASMAVHEAQHQKDYLEGRSFYDVEGERRALGAQLTALRAMMAPYNELYTVEFWYQNPSYVNIPEDQRNW